MLSPLWVLHSVQAWTHDWHPMQRLASTNISSAADTGMVVYCCASSFVACSGASALRTRTAHTLYSGIFEMGSCDAIVS